MQLAVDTDRYGISILKVDPCGKGTSEIKLQLELHFVINVLIVLKHIPRAFK